MDTIQNVVLNGCDSCTNGLNHTNLGELITCGITLAVALIIRAIEKRKLTKRRS